MSTTLTMNNPLYHQIINELGFSRRTNPEWWLTDTGELSGIDELRRRVAQCGSDGTIELSENDCAILWHAATDFQFEYLEFSFDRHHQRFVNVLGELS